MAEPQVIPARHGVATFVPAGQSIKIINTSGSQVVDTWAFALPQPAPKKDVEEKTKANVEVSKEQTEKAAEQIKSKTGELPSQEEAEAATREAQVQAEKAEQDGQKKSGWSSYVPSIPNLGLTGKKGEEGKDTSKETQQQKNSRSWGEYFKPGKGFSSYIPQTATDTVSKFVSIHNRDTNKTYMEQLQDFSKTPVGAAGMSAFTGSGYSGSLYAGYQAWNARNAADAPNMEFMSLPHSRAATLHMVPKMGDTLVTNLREPILTVIEDSSPGVHDTLIAACDPQRYRQLGVDKWEEHGSCAENLVLALKELNERAGLKGAKAVGADVTINNVPPPLNLFMNIPWTTGGNVSFKAPRTKAGDYIRFRAERDVVVVMSACPQDVLDINGKNPTDANFIVEEESAASAIKRTTAPKKKPASVQNTTAGAANTASPPAKAAPKKKPPPPSNPPPAKSNAQATQAPKPVQSQPVKKPPPSQPVKTPALPAKAPAQKVAQSASKPIKKPVPPSVKPQLNGSPATATDKKKPRKLVRQPSEA